MGSSTRPGALELGLFLPLMENWFGDRWLPRWPELMDLARTAEAIGFDTLLVPDHLVFGQSPYWGIPEGEPRGTWEAWSVLAALAATTERVGLGPFVCCTGFRNPALLAKMAATVDEVSEGRLVLGLGCGSHPPEYRAFGYPYDHRVSRFDEAISIIAPLLREGRADFAGRFHSAVDCEITPRGPRPGGPPIWIAGYQPRMMGLAARWGDAFVTAWHPAPAALAEPWRLLDFACREQGRDPATIARVVGAIVSVGERVNPALPAVTLSGATEELAARLLAFAEAGVRQLVVMLEPRDVRGLERFAPVVKAIRAHDRG
jgi:probable F420-dependent oxidoreductase